MSDTVKKAKRVYKFGCIDESGMSLLSPRGIDGDEHDTLEEAFVEACGMIKDGCEQVSIVRCFFSPRHECFVEDSKFGSITVDANSSSVAEEDEDEE